jgi:hypothetical protein
MKEYTRRPEEKPFPASCLAGSKLDRPAQLSFCRRLQKIAHSPQKLLKEKNCSQNLLTMSKFIVSKNLLNKFAHGESNLLTENQICSRRIKFAHGESNLITENQFCSWRIMNCPSFYLQSKYVRMTRFKCTHKLLKAKKICSQ